MSKAMFDSMHVVEEIAASFEGLVKNKLQNRLDSFYVVGSYAQGNISKQRPDVNYLLIFDGFTKPKDYLDVGEICREVEGAFSSQVTIKFEFRPFRYIKPRYCNDLEISINPILISTGEITAMGGVVFNKWFTEGLKKTNRLVFGSDYLKRLSEEVITRDDLKNNTLLFMTMPLSRAPAQYNDEESYLLLNESLVNAKNIAYFGIEAAMTNEELAEKAYLKYVHDKEKMVDFYADRYGKKVARMVERILEVRAEYSSFRENPKVAEEMFEIALTLASEVRSKVYSSME